MQVTMLMQNMVEIEPYMLNSSIEKINRLKAKDYILDWFNQRIATHKEGLPNIIPSHIGSKILILKSGTGSGKSVTIGPELHLNFPYLSNKYIALTQPRILTTLEIASNISKKYDNKMITGNNLGYQTKNFYLLPRRGLIVMVEEILAIQLSTMTDKEFIDRYAFIILDECHNRTSSMDISMFLLKNLLSRNYRDPSCPFVILSSATVDVNRYSNYFGVNRENVITIKGINYEIEDNFQDTDVENYIKKAARTAIDIHLTNTNDYKEIVRDILIFVASSNDILNISTILEKNNNINEPFLVISLTSDEYKKGNGYRDIIKHISLISMVKNGVTIQPMRRIIISTNVAETGLTLDYLKYTIDTGYSNQLIFDPIYGVNVFTKRNISKSNARQRRGRVGRISTGKWYPMYTYQAFEQLEEDNTPDILTSDVTLLILKLIIKYTILDWNGVVSNNIRHTGVFNIDDIKLIDNISIDSYEYSMEKLFILGLIDSNYIPSSLGLASTKFKSLELESIMLVLNGYVHECNIKDIITIAAFSSIGVSAYIHKNNTYRYTDISCGTSLYSYDDFIEAVFIWNRFNKIIKKNVDIDNIKKWCIENGLIYEGLLYASSIIDGIIFTLSQNIGLSINYNGLKLPKDKYDLENIIDNDSYTGIQEIKKIKKCIYESYRFNIAIWNNLTSTYKMDVTNNDISISSIIFDIKDSTIELPEVVIVGSKIIKRRGNIEFLFIGTNVSVMDGFVNIDETFIVS